MAKKATVKYENPVVQYKDNLLLTTIGDVWAYYKINPFQINVANIEDKRQYKDSFIDVFERLQKYDDVDLKLLPQDMDLAGRIQGTSPDWANDLRDVAEYYIGQEEVNLLQSEFNTAVIDTFYIGVKLKNTSVGDDLKDKVSFVTDLVLKRFAETLRYQVKLTDDYFNRYETMNDDVLGILRPLNAEKLSEEKLVAMLGLTYRHESDTSLLKMRDTVFDLSHTGFVERIADNKTDYFTHLVVNLPDKIQFLELLPELQSFKFPLEVHIKINYPQRDGWRGLRQQTKQSKGKYRDEMRDAYNTNEDSSKRSELNYKLAKDLVNVLDDKNGFIGWSIILVVRDEDLAELKKLVSKVKTRLNTFDRDIEVYQPTFQQEQLLYQTLPAVALGVFKHWQQFTTIPALAELMFGTTQALGANTGFYVGRVLNLQKYRGVDSAVASSRLLLLLNLVVSNKGIKGAKTDSPHVALSGDTGQGKSFLFKILLLHMAMFNTKILYIDPKQEVRRWFMRALEKEKNSYFQKLIKSFHFVTLNANDKANLGILDPMLTLNTQSSEDDIPDVMTLIKEMLTQVRSVSDSILIETALNKAIKSVCSRRIQGEKVGTLTVFDELAKGSDDEKQLAEFYRSIVPETMLKLAFSDGTTDSLQFNDKRTILEVTGLQLPKANQDSRTYSETQKYSIALMLALGKYLEKFGRANPDEFTLEMIDEAWIFNTSQAGKNVFDSIKRLGRSENNALFYATQRVNDSSGEDSIGQFGQLFAFDSVDDRPNILRQFNLPVNKANLRLLEDLQKGQCLFRDIYGRVGKVVIHSLFDEWTTALKTVNTNESARLEEKYG
ncbi:ATP-binding protein [Leuconostoc mesenteroides]|uniref:ATP-binding protein n=1 Tax=Leuconostoc mesenteroides TaxID=1245 RepID=UPI000681F73C|nr:ATP-binding protein [Leuconostoc mesenteroides]KMY77358.1 conjugal transfer protein [Leuconostoc mesenteroides subsp. mesenteroides]